MWDALSNERTGLSFTIAAGHRQRSHSQVQVPWDSCPYFTVSDSRFPQSGGPGSRIYIPQDQGGQIVPPGSGLPFRLLLRLAELRFRYSNRPPRGELGTDRIENIASMNSSVFASRVSCRGNLFIEPLLSSERFLLAPSFRLSGIMSQYSTEATICNKTVGCFSTYT
jgi:hypothetical protein